MINNTIYCLISWFTIALSIVMFMHFYPEKRWNNRMLDILMWCIWGLMISVEAWDSQHGFIPWIQMVVYGILNAIILNIFYVCKYKTALMWLWFYNLCIAIFKIPILTIRGVLNNEDLYYANVLARRAISELICSLFLLGIGIFLCFKYRAQIANMLKQLTKLRSRSYVFLIIESVMYVIIVKMMHLGEAQFEQKDLVLNMITVMGMTVGIILCLLYVVYMQSKDEKNNLFIQQQMLIKENAMIKDYCRQDAKRFHDLKHTFMYLQECIENQKYDLAKQCVEEHIEEVKVQQRQVWTGIEDIDFILNYKHQQMQHHSIKFVLNVEVYQTPCMSGENLMIVLGNILDNAIEAAEKCPVNERKIDLTIKNINEMFLIRVKNTCQKKPKEQNNRFMTEKDDMIYHGWGIENVEKIIEDANGKLQYEYENGWFITNILLNE